MSSIDIDEEDDYFVASSSCHCVFDVDDSFHFSVTTFQMMRATLDGISLALNSILRVVGDIRERKNALLFIAGSIYRRR